MPAPLDCSNKHVNAANQPVANNASRLRFSRNNRAQYIVINAHKVLSQLWRTRNRVGRAVKVTNIEATKADHWEHTRRETRYVRTDNNAPSTRSTVRPTPIELPKSLK